MKKRFVQSSSSDPSVVSSSVDTSLSLQPYRVLTLESDIQRQLSYYNFKRLSDRRRSSERGTAKKGFIKFTCVPLDLTFIERHQLTSYLLFKQASIRSLCSRRRFSDQSHRSSSSNESSSSSFECINRIKPLWRIR